MTVPSDYSACDTEPIHTPGTIQPFGVLLVLDSNTLKVRHASKNGRSAFGHGSAEPLGSTAAELLGPTAETILRDALAKDGLFDHQPIPVSGPGINASRWHGAVHDRGGLVFVELEPVDEAMTSPLAVLADIRGSVQRLTATRAVSDFCVAAAREFRSLTGYDRVMVYRFDAECNGEVVAEERRGDLEPYLGLHYPASDIPAQARASFKVNRIRVIPDATAEQIPVVSEPDALAELPLDLSRCLLRTPALVHREYLHNMGVRASLTASLVVGDRLWGLIACHHMTPKRPGQTEREACDLLSRMASTHLALVAESENRNYLTALAAALQRTVVRIGATVPPIAALAKDPADLLALVGAGGAVVWRSGRGMQFGQTPPGEALPDLVAWIKGLAVQLVETDRLSQRHIPANAFSKVASGLLALEVSRDNEEYILWFRPEELQTINWGGDPHGATSANGRLSPRSSFAVWRETVRARSLPWLPAELENARRIKELLLEAASRSSIRLEAMLPICAWCKKIRDEPGYWHGVEEFIRTLVDVRFTHGVCPECMIKQMTEFSSHRAESRPRS